MGIIIPQFFIFFAMAHQREYNFTNNCLEIRKSCSITFAYNKSTPTSSYKNQRNKQSNSTCGEQWDVTKFYGCMRSRDKRTKWAYKRVQECEITKQDLRSSPCTQPKLFKVFMYVATRLYHFLSETSLDIPISYHQAFHLYQWKRNHASK